MAEEKITAASFQARVAGDPGVWVLDFYADWCGPCQMIAPFISQLAEEYDGRISVGKINVDEEPSLAAAFSVNSIPLVVVMKGGTVLETSLGYAEKDTLRALIERALAR